MFFDHELDTSGVVGPRQWPLIDAAAINIYSKQLILLYFFNCAANILFTMVVDIQNLLKDFDIITK